MSIERRYDYTSVKGEPRLQKVRFSGKRFVITSWDRRREVWLRGLSDDQYGHWVKALYRLPEVVAALRVDVPIWWCEGEKDSDALAAFGLVATTTPNPSELWDDQVRWFTRYRTQSEVMVICDVDLHGGWWGWERYTRLLRIGVAAPRIHVLAPPRGFKDVAELIEAGGRPSDLRSVDLDRLRRVAERYGVARASRYSHRRGAPTTEDVEEVRNWQPQVISRRRVKTPAPSPSPDSANRGRGRGSNTPLGERTR